jgi:hypothetical protein
VRETPRCGFFDPTAALCAFDLTFIITKGRGGVFQ